MLPRYEEKVRVCIGYYETVFLESGNQILCALNHTVSWYSYHHLGDDIETVPPLLPVSRSNAYPLVYSTEDLLVYKLLTLERS